MIRIKTMFSGNRRIFAATAAAISITALCWAQQATDPTSQKKIRRGIDRVVVPPANTTTPPSTTTKTETKRRPFDLDERVIKPTKKTEADTPVVPKGRIVDYSSRLPQLKNVTVSMICATSDSKQKSVVLKWVIDNQWLPEQGYNLYRKGPGDTDFKKIAGPIKENPNASSITLPAAIGPAKTINIAMLQKQARANVQIPSSMMQAFNPAPQYVESSKPVFDELKQLRLKEFTPVVAKTRPSFMTVKPDAFPKLNGYYQKFKIQRTIPFNAQAIGSTAPRSLVPKSSGKAAKLAPIAKTPIQQTVEARRALLMGSLVNKSVCDALGLGYVDSAVEEGKTYEYQLRRVTNGTDIQTPAACTITVGADPLPSRPTDLSACQMDTKNVALRWKLDDSKTSARVISYNIFRIVGFNKQQVNSQPLMVGPVEDGKGNYTDPLYYFTDNKVPVGKVRYELVGVDAFGRKTEPTSVDLTMADWETPQPVTQVTCAANNGQVYIYWQPSLKSVGSKPTKDDAAMYNVYRYDQEGSKVWTKLNDEPIKPSYIAPPALGKQYAVKMATINRSSNLSFIDKTCQKDNYYQYTVVAVYKKNMIETVPSPVQTVGIPDSDPPAAVASLAGKHVALVNQTPDFRLDARWVKPFVRPTVPIAKVKNLNFDPATLVAKQAAPAKSASTQPFTVQKINAQGKTATTKTGSLVVTGAKPLVRLPSDLIKASIDNSDLGGKIVLTWAASPLKAPVRYKIYRSSGTGFRVVAGLDKLISPAIIRPVAKVGGGSAAPAATSARTLSSVQYMGASPADLRISATGKQSNVPQIQNKGVTLEYIKKVDLAAVSKDSYQLLGETTSTTYQDMLPRSRPMYYNYRIVQVNRWGVEGKSSFVQVRVGATIQPPTPEVVSAYANTDGGVTLTVKPLENKEECSKYVIYRKPIDLSSIAKQLKPSVALATKLPASTTNGTVSKPTGSLVFNAGMKITPASITVAPAVATKALDRGMRTRPTMPTGNLELIKDIRLILAKPDYQVVGEIGADAIDKNGYVRYNDIKDLTPNQLYSYTVVAVDADSWKSEASKPETASPWKVTVPPVGNLKAIASTSGNGVVLSWTAPAGEIMGYAVMKGVAKNTEYVQISDTIKPTTFTDFGVIKGRTYTYRVQAVDPLGNLSDPVSVEFSLPK